MKHQDNLKGLRVLVVEDMVLIADDLADMLKERGCEVLGPAGCVRSAIEIVRNEPLDGAVLDINLGDDEYSFPIAKALDEREVPYVFLSGYDMGRILPTQHKDARKLSKPVQPGALTEAVAKFSRQHQR